MRRSRKLRFRGRRRAPLESVRKALVSAVASSLGMGPVFAGSSRRISRDADRNLAPRVEPLEDRRLLAGVNYVVLDFTPDQIEDEFQAGDFADLFDGAAVSVANQFLNYDDGDNVIDSADATRAAKKIASKVRQILRPFTSDPDIDLRLLFTPKVTQSFDPGAGETRLVRGQASDSENTYVIYIGDQSPVANLPDLGMAHPAFEGENAEFYAYIFAGGVSDHLASGSYRW